MYFGIHHMSVITHNFMPCIHVHRLVVVIIIAQLIYLILITYFQSGHRIEVDKNQQKET